MSTLSARIADLAMRASTATKEVRTLLNGNAGDNSALHTAAKANLVVALNEVLGVAQAAVAAAGALIDDTSAASTTKTYSVTKIRDLVATSISQLTTGAPAALDTLDELAAALGDDANFAATITAALGNRLRVDAAQVLSAGQKAQGRANLEVYSTAEIGNPDTNFVAVFEAGLV